MMAAKLSIHHSVKNEKGQGIIEVVLVLPFLFTFVALLYKINMASQMAINNTQISRSQLFVLTANSSEYPRLQFRFNEQGGRWMASEGHVRLVMGVADPSALAGQNNDDGTELQPIPQIQKIARLGTTVKGSSDAGEVANRNDIRVRNTVAICTQFNTAEAPGGKTVDLNPTNLGKMGSRRWPYAGTICKYESNE